MKKRVNLSILFLIVICWILTISASAEVVDKIVAIVNSDIITLVELNRETAPYRAKIAAGTYPEDQKVKMTQEINIKILNNLIDQSLVHQEAKKYRIKVSKNAVDKAVENIMQSRSMSQEDLEKALKKDGKTLTEYRKNIKNQILRSKLIHHAVKSKAVVLESDIKHYYENNQEKYSGSKKYYLRNIVLNQEDKIQEVSRQLNETEDFKSLAKKYSIAPNAEDGGDLGLFDIQSFPDNIKKELEKLKKGEFSHVIKTARGFQLFYIEDIVFEGRRTYDQARDEIHDLLYNKKAEKKFTTWLETLEKSAHIKIML